MSHVDPYPHYSRPERRADAAMHVAGVGFAVFASAWLINLASGATHTGTPNAGTIAAVSIYGAALIASFVASACYHFTPRETWRPVLRRIDDAAIYLKIAGTYTPLVVLVGSAFAYGVLAVIWGLATIGAVSKLFFWGKPGHWGTALYVGMGWISVALMTSLYPVLPRAGMALLIGGGLIYSAGAVVFSLEGVRFQNAIWHGFVLTASVCFFVTISMGLAAPV